MGDVVNLATARILRDLTRAAERIRTDPSWFEYRIDPVILHPLDHEERVAIHGPECASWACPGAASAVAGLCTCGGAR